MSGGADAAGRSFCWRARHVLPMCGLPLDGGWVRVERGRIVAVGRRDPPGDAVDLGDAILLPGLVNAHTHLEFSGLDRPLDVAGGLPDWIGRVVAWRREQTLGGAGRAEAVRAGLVESAAAGVTTLGEIATSGAADVLDAYAAGGPRVRVFREGLGLAPAAVTTAVAAVRGDLDRLRSRGLAAGVSPHAPYSVAEPLGRRLLAEAVARRLPVAMHLAESDAEEEFLAHGTGPFRARLEALGAWPAAAPPRLLPTVEWIGRLARAARGLVVHGTHLGRDPAALARLARHRDRLCVVVCPRTTLALSGGHPPVTLLRDAGLRVALATDGRGSNPDLSLLAECRAVVDAGLVNPAEALAMATLHGAWALDLDHRCGSLHPGRAADLVVIRPASARAEPYAAVLDPGASIVATIRSGRAIHGGVGSCGMVGGI